MRFALLATLVCLGAAPAPGAEPLRDKTLVTWVRIDDPRQRGVAPLAIQNVPGQFDAIVLGEVEPGRWMAGSDTFRRTQRDQKANAAEPGDGSRLLALAAAYRGNEVTIYRDGQPYASYTHEGPPAEFGPGAIVLMGLRHWELVGPTLRGSIADARIYDHALDPQAIARLAPDRPSDPPPVAWWDFEEDPPRDRMGRYPDGHLVGAASIANGELKLEGGYLLVNAEPPRTRDREDWPAYHIAVRPQEGLARPYDANGCLYWKGRYHLMYIYQDRSRPQEGHSWGHLSSADLVNWTYHPPALVPEPGDADVGTFSGNAFLNADGVPMLGWFGIDAGVCVATAQDDDLIRWKKHPGNPIIPMPKPGEPGHGVYRVWDPYLWRDGDRYVCLLGGNTLPSGKDTLDAWTSTDLVSWTRQGPFYEHPDPAWTTEGEDCSCPDFFKLGDRHVLLCISHKVGARAYVGRYDAERVRFVPERHIRMNWPGGQFFAPESLVDDRGRRIIWAWVTDPRSIKTQQVSGSGVQSLPRVIGLAADATLTITPPDELKTLRRDHRSVGAQALSDGADWPLEGIAGKQLELAVEIEPGAARTIGLAVRRSTDGAEETVIEYDTAANVLRIDMSRSTRREDVVYTQGPLDTGGVFRAGDYPNPRATVEAPLKLATVEPLRLRIFLDGPMLEVFANDRQCLTQQVFPSREDSLRIVLRARGAGATLRSLDAWDMAAARFDGP